jgi:hypothetical protein
LPWNGRDICIAVQPGMIGSSASVPTSVNGWLARAAVCPIVNVSGTKVPWWAAGDSTPPWKTLQRCGMRNE